MKVVTSKKFKSNQEIFTFYNKFGWVILKNKINKNELSNICRELDLFYKKYTGKKCLDALVYLNKANKKKLHKLYTISSKLSLLKELNLKLSKFQNIIHPKKNVFEVDCAYMISLPRDKRLVYDYHQESNYMKNFDDILTIHYPLFQQSNEKNGSMSVLSKSHKLGNLPFTKKRYSSNSYTNLVPKNIDKFKSRYEEVLFQLELGDVAFFHKDTIHKSNSNYSKTCRIVGIGRFTSSPFGDFTILKPSEL